MNKLDTVSYDFFLYCPRATLRTFIEVYHLLVFYQQGGETPTTARHGLSDIRNLLILFRNLIRLTVEPNVATRFAGAFCLAYFFQFCFILHTMSSRQWAANQSSPSGATV